MEQYTIEDIRSRRKPEDLAIVRGCLYAVLKYESDLSTTEIGRLVNRTHSTIVTQGNLYYWRYRRYGEHADTIQAVRDAYQHLLF